MRIRPSGSSIIVGILVILLAVAIVYAVVGWNRGGDDLSVVTSAGLVAMGAGILITLALGIGLMALLFYSSRHD